MTQLLAGVPIVLSIISVAISTLAFFNSRRRVKIAVEDAINRKISEINDGFAKYNVEGPYARMLGVPEEELQTFTAKSVLLFQQLTLLRMVFMHRRVIGRKALAGYETWARDVLWPWVSADSRMTQVWMQYSFVRDLEGPQFHEWLRKAVPFGSVQPLSRGPAPSSLANSAGTRVEAGPGNPAAAQQPSGPTRHCT